MKIEGNAWEMSKIPDFPGGARDPPGKSPKMALRGPLGVKRKFVEKMVV